MWRPLGERRSSCHSLSHYQLDIKALSSSLKSEHCLSCWDIFIIIRRAAWLITISRKETTATEEETTKPINSRCPTSEDWQNHSGSRCKPTPRQRYLYAGNEVCKFYLQSIKWGEKNARVWHWFHVDDLHCVRGFQFLLGLSCGHVFNTLTHRAWTRQRMTGNAQYKQESRTVRNPHQLRWLSTPYKLVKNFLVVLEKKLKTKPRKTSLPLKEKLLHCQKSTLQTYKRTFFFLN